MVRENNVDAVKTLALKKWENGANCAQATASGLLELYAFYPESRMIYDALIPFGGGFRQGSICGTISGCLAAISIILVHFKAPSEIINSATQEFKELIRTKFGALECNSLLFPFRLPDGKINKEDPARRIFCTHLVEFAVENAEKIIEKTGFIHSS